TDKLVVMPGGERGASSALGAPIGAVEARSGEARSSSPSPQSPSKTGVNALATGEGRGGGAAASSNVRALAGAAPRVEVLGTAALKADPEPRRSPTEQLEAQSLPFARTDARAEARAAAAERRAEAKAKGYEGEMCSECLNFTLVRNGTCLKCDTCGSTTGC